MMHETHKRPGFIAAVLHRLSGIALAIFLPLHFAVLGTALNNAATLDRILSLTNNPVVKLAETGLVVAFAMHMALGLRILAIEFAGIRERTGTAVSLCVGVALVLGLTFLLNAGS
jgi:fumarate reductase subunit D